MKNNNCWDSIFGIQIIELDGVKIKMRCIFCLKERESSEEHVFPDSIGGNLVIYTVCKECNEYLGHSVDSPLIDHWIIQSIRLAKRIPGKSGKLPNIFSQGVSADNKDVKIRIHLDDSGKPKKAYVVPHKEFTPEDDDEPGKLSLIVDASDIELLPDMINKFMKRNKLPALTDDQLSKLVIESHQTTNAHYSFTFDTVRYRAGILKIAYELAFRWIGYQYLSDPIATQIRECLRKSPSDVGECLIGGTIELVEENKCKVGELFPKAGDSHIGALLRVDNYLAVYVRVFDAFEGLIKVSNDDFRFNVDPKAIVLNPSTGLVDEGEFWEMQKQYS